MIEGRDPSFLWGGEELISEKANGAVGVVRRATSPPRLSRNWGVELPVVKLGKSWAN